MKKKIILLLIIIILILLGFFFLYKKEKTIKQDNKPKVELSSNFDLNLLKLVNQEEKDNFLISPYSIKMALSLLKEGANGNSLNEINNTLKEPPASINNKNIKIANALFIRDIYQKYIEKDFISNLQKKYNSDILIDKFKTPDVINNWVNKNTDGMINKVLDNMTDDFVLGLANAIAIDVKWQDEFECVSTTEEKFTNSNNKDIKAQMMHNSYSYEDIKYIKSDKAEGIILPYIKESNLEFIGILPTKNINDYIENNLESDLSNLDKLATSANSKLQINLSIPRFNFDYSLNTFKDILIKMGIKDVFDSGKADLTKIITKDNLIKSNSGNIYVDDAIHKTYIDFNESGTKAATVTYFGVKNTALIRDDNETIDIKFNKPFITIIREKDSNEILFIGVVNNPNIWNGTTCQKQEI